MVDMGIRRTCAFDNMSLDFTETRLQQKMMTSRTTDVNKYKRKEKTIIIIIHAYI